MNRFVSVFLSIVVIAAGAAAFRLPKLDQRPMHADEAVQAARFRKLLEEGQWRYDPNEFHGPTLNFATLPVAWIRGIKRFADTSEFDYRVVPAVFGIATILLLVLIADGLGRSATVWAALLMAVSPAATFYSRYYIHETLLVCFTLGALVCGWRYHRSRRLGWCLAAGICLGLVQATKETSVLIYASMIVAALATWLWGCLVDSKENRNQGTRWQFTHMVAALAVAVFVALFLLTTCFTNRDGFADSINTYLPWFNRASGQSPHLHPPSYYLHILLWWQRNDLLGIVDGAPVWSEGVILVLAAIGAVVSLGPARGIAHGDRSLARFVTFYAVLLTVAYSVIPYKTCWCLLGFLNALILVAGIGAAWLIRRTPFATLRTAVALLLLAGVGHLGGQAYRASFVDDCDETNPYVYVHTTRNTVELYEKLEELAAASPLGHNMRINVVTQDAYYWPLPWYLRKFNRERVRYWLEIPDDLATPIVITVPEFDAEIDEQLRETHRMTGYYTLRPGVFVLLFVRDDVWESHLDST